MLDDPSNLFVVDLATVTSESSGIPSFVQVVSCLYLGTCFEALAASEQESSNNIKNTAGPLSAVKSKSTDDSISRLTQKSLLKMIDSRIGLTRFTDILKRPLMPPQKSGTTSSDSAILFFSASFQKFYEERVTAIRHAIFDFYSAGPGGINGGDSQERQIISIQTQQIANLEKQINELLQNKSSNGVAINQLNAISQVEAELDEMKNKYNKLYEDNIRMEQDLMIYKQNESILKEALTQEQQRAENAEIQINDLRVYLSDQEKTWNDFQLKSLKEMQQYEKNAKDSQAYANSLLMEIEQYRNESKNITNPQNLIIQQTREIETKLLDQIFSLEQICQSKQEEVNILNNKILEMEKEYKSAIISWEQKVEMISFDLEQNTIRAEEEEQDLKRQILVLQQELHQAHTEAAEYQTHTNEIESQLLHKISTLENDILNSHAEVERLTVALSSYEKETNNKIIILQERLHESEIIASKEMQQNESMKSNYLSRISDLEQMLKAAQSENTSLKATVGENESLLVQQVSELEKLLEISRSELIAMEDSYNASELKHLNAIQALENQIKLLQLNAEKNKETESNLMQKISTLQENLMSSQSEVERLSMQSNTFDNESMNKIHVLQQQLQQLKVEQEQKIVENNTLQSKTNELLKQIAYNEGLNMDLKKELQSIEEKKLEFEQLILSLKEKVINLSNINQQLQDENAHSNRRILLLESELRVPVEDKRKSEEMIHQLEDRNAKLTQEIWRLEIELKSSLENNNINKVSVPTEQSSVRPVPSANDQIIHDSNLIQLIETVKSFVQKVGIDAEEQLALLSDPSDADISVVDKIDAIIEIIGLFSDTFSLIAEHASESAQSSGLDHFESEEGTLERVLEGIDYLTTTLFDKKDTIEKYDMKIIELNNTIKTNNDELTGAYVELSTEVGNNLKLTNDIQEKDKEINRLIALVEQNTAEIRRSSAEIESLKSTLNSAATSKSASSTPGAEGTYFVSNNFRYKNGCCPFAHK